METYEKQIKILSNTQGHENILSLSVGYTKGGYNWYNGACEKRGYVLYCTPEERSDRANGITSVTSVLGKGRKMLLLETARRSENALHKAIELAELKSAELVRVTCEQYGITVEEA